MSTGGAESQAAVLDGDGALAAGATTPAEGEKVETKTVESKTKPVPAPSQKTSAPKKPAGKSADAGAPKLSKLELAQKKRKEDRERKRLEAQRAREKREAERNKPVTLASRKKAQKQAAAARAAKAAKIVLDEARGDISDVLLFVRFSGYVWTCNRRGSNDFGKWHRRYLELHYKEARFLKKRGGTSATPRSYPVLKGTKIKSMKKVSTIPGHADESFPSFELLIGGTSLRHWIAVPSVAALEGWMHAFREFVPSVMSILRSSRMPSKSLAELEREQQHQLAEDKKLETMRNHIKTIFKLANPKHSGTILKEQLIAGIHAVQQNPVSLAKLESDPVLKVLLEPRVWLQSLMDLDTHRDGQVSFDEVLHFVRLIETRSDRRRMALRELFSLIDTDNNGEIDPEEMMNAIRAGSTELRELLLSEDALKPLLNPDTYGSSFDVIDRNKDGVIDVEELVAFCNEYEERAMTRMHSLNLFFRLVDANNDGELDKDEILSALETNPECRTLIAEEPSLAPLLNPETYAGAFHMMDTDGDGTISLHELFVFCGVREDKLSSRLHMWRQVFDMAVATTERQSGGRTGLPSTATLGSLNKGEKTVTLFALLSVFASDPKAAKIAAESDVLQLLCRPSTFNEGATKFNHFAHEYHNEIDPFEMVKRDAEHPIEALNRRGLHVGVHVRVELFGEQSLDNKDGDGGSDKRTRQKGTVTFLGYPNGFEKDDVGVWCGIALDRPRGTGDGLFRSQGKESRCFACLPRHGIFVRPDFAHIDIVDEEGREMEALERQHQEEVDHEPMPALPLAAFIDFCEAVASHEDEGHTIFVGGEEVVADDVRDGPETDHPTAGKFGNFDPSAPDEFTVPPDQDKKGAPEWHAHVGRSKWKGHGSSMSGLFALKDTSTDRLNRQYMFDKKKEKKILEARKRREERARVVEEKRLAQLHAAEIEAEKIEASKSDKERARDAAVKARELELQQLLHKAHDHMLLRVPPVKGQELYCVECRRIQIEYQKRVRQDAENDRRDQFDDWLEKAVTVKKVRDELWAAEEEDRQRAEDRKKGAFKETCKRDRKRFMVRRRMAGKPEDSIIREIRKNEPNLFTGKRKKKKEKKKKKKKKKKEKVKTPEGQGGEDPDFDDDDDDDEDDDADDDAPAEKMDDYGRADADRAGGPERDPSFLSWDAVDARLEARLNTLIAAFNVEWQKVVDDRTLRFQEEKTKSVALQREIETGNATEATTRQEFDDETERRRLAERDIRPAEDKILRREKSNRQIYVEAVSQMRTRTRLGRLLWQRTLRADGQTHTHQVYDAARQKSYVIKFIPCANESEVATVMDDAYLIKRVASECRYLVDVDDCFYHSVSGVGGGYYIVVCIFECCEGGEAMKAVVDAAHGARPRISDGQLLRWTEHASSALASLHEHQFVHRNLKPENMFLTAKGRYDEGHQDLKIGDYPITKTFEATLPEASTYVGAPRFLAPELLQQDFFPGVIAPPLDVWALGCSVYYLATGKEICLRQDGSFPSPLEEMLLAVPARFGTPIRDVVRACLQLHPEDRPTAIEVGEIAHAELVAQENERNARKRNAKAITNLFELIDDDQSGYIELDELLTATQSNKRVIRLLKKSERLRALLQPEKVRPFFEKMDENGDGQLELGEMLDFCQLLHHEQTFEKELLNNVVELFNLIDRDHKLMINKEEFLEAIEFRPDVARIMHAHPKLELMLDPSKFDTVFRELDTHHTGHVTLDELMEFTIWNHEEEEAREQERELQRAKARVWRQVDRERRKR
jgi:Ca2+-binding EF-hand superfamily protein